MFQNKRTIRIFGKVLGKWIKVKWKKYKMIYDDDEE